MMSTRPCGNCKKTVYVNEKMDAEGRWYHRPCFKCMAPNCGTSLTMRTFQMAALDDSVIDELTRRPLKVLVCKEHVPMPKASISSDSLSLKHSTTAPKPAMAGLHRSFMGGRGKDTSLEDGDDYRTPTTPKISHSPRSLDQGSHANILKGVAKEHKDTPLSVSTAAHLASSKSHDSLHSGSSSANPHTPKSAESEVRSMSTTTLPKFRNGRFTVDPSSTTDSIAASHVAAEDAQDPTKDDDSYRTIPVRHRDYGHTEGTAEEPEDNKQERIFTTKESHNNHSHESSSHDIDVSLETAEDVTERSEREHHHINTKDVHAVEEAEVKAPHGAKEEHKLVGMAFHSKLMDQSSSKDDNPEVDDDEWDTTPADDYSRRETVAGM
ncbi:hypothetical protein EC991_003608 [Linnemannia zychae]|nr:hypothetical protein EC991_003608 [Linnemannia zychae]